MNKTTKNLTVLGFDFGLKRIGVAVGQSITKSATPLAILNTKAGMPPWDDIAELINKWQPDALIVGIPINMDETEQEITKFAQNFAHQLRKRYNLPVHIIDERLTTKAAREEVYIKGGYKALQKEAIDSIAAKLIVEDWMRENL
jgi:putative Holliday junction resolvase